MKRATQRIFVQAPRVGRLLFAWGLCWMMPALQGSATAQPGILIQSGALDVAEDPTAQVPRNKAGFSVKDSIEISYIVDPSPGLRVDEQQIGAAPLMSPDRRHFLLVTQSGLIQSNRLEATLWLFDATATRKYLVHLRKSIPTPKIIARLSATSNTAIISDVRWLDSTRIAFLGKQDSPYQRLFEVDLSTGTLNAITDNESYVTAYDVKGNTVAYTTLNIHRHRTTFNSDVGGLLVCT